MSNILKLKKGDLRRYLYRQQAGVCPYCFRLMTMEPDRCKEPDYATIEHIVSTNNGGPNTPDNLITACQRCNGLKGDSPLLTFLLQIHRGDRPYTVAATV